MYPGYVHAIKKEKRNRETEEGDLTGGRKWRVASRRIRIRFSLRYYFAGRNVPRPELPKLEGASHPREVPVGYLRSIFRPFGIVRRRMDTFGRWERRGRRDERSKDRGIDRKRLALWGLYLCASPFARPRKFTPWHNRSIRESRNAADH